MSGPRRKRQARRRDAGPSLGGLSLTASTVIEQAPAGTAIGSVLGATSGSALSLIDDAGGRFALSGATVVAGAVATDHAVAAGHAIVLREVLAGYANSPRDTVLWVDVTEAEEAGSVAPPPGYDMFYVLGDSLMTSVVANADRDPVLDAPVANTAQLVMDGTLADYGQIRTDTAPIAMRTEGVAYLSPIESLLRRYQSVFGVPHGRKAFVVGTGRQGSKLLDTGSFDWDPAGPGSHLVVARDGCNAAHALAKAAEPWSRVRGVVICLNSNANSGEFGSADNRAAWIGLIDYVRAEFAGVNAETPIILVGPVKSQFTDYRDDIAHAVGQRPLCYNVNFPLPTVSADNLHPTQAENRTGGASFADAIVAAPEPGTVEDIVIPPANGAAPDVDVESAEVVVMVGYGRAVTASIADGSFSVDGGAFGAAARTVHWGSRIVVRRRSPASAGTTATATLTVGTKSAPFDVTTIAPRVQIPAPGSLIVESTTGNMRVAGSGLMMES